MCADEVQYIVNDRNYYYLVPGDEQTPKNTIGGGDAMTRCYLCHLKKRWIACLRLSVAKYYFQQECTYSTNDRHFLLPVFDPS